MFSFPSVLILLFGIALVTYAFVSLRQGYYWGSMYKVARNEMPHRFFRTIVILLVLGVFLVAIAIFLPSELL